MTTYAPLFIARRAIQPRPKPPQPLALSAPRSRAAIQRLQNSTRQRAPQDINRDEAVAPGSCRCPSMLTGTIRIMAV